MIGKEHSYTSEEAMWHEFQGGCTQAFARLYEYYADSLYDYSTRFTSDRDLIKDCIHDLFVELWRSRSNLSATTSVRYYLLACIKRKVVRHLELNQRNIKGEASLLEGKSSADTVTPEVRIIGQQDLQQTEYGLHRAMDQLTRRQREAIFLKFYQNMPYEEIADIMGVNAQSAYNLIFNALRTLKKHLAVENIALLLLMTVMQGNF